MTCHSCGSTKHFAYDCKCEVEDAKLTLHLTLVGSTLTQKNFLVDLGHGILDSACTKTVAGEVWVNEFLPMLSEKEQVEVQRSARKSKSLFRFGDGIETKSLREISLPVYICGKQTTIQVEIVPHDIPLLISRPTMTKIGMILDTMSHTVTVNQESFSLLFSDSGHYALPVSPWCVKNVNVVFHIEDLSKYSKAEKLKKAQKLHRQFAHASKERLIKLMKGAGCEDKEFIELLEEVCEKCKFCLKYRHKKPKPIVALPKTDRFNELVLMDLKELVKGSLWILHMICCGTRYTAACIIKRKKKEVVVSAVIKIWLAYFGAPRKFQFDNGGEFENEVMKELNEKFNVEIDTSPAESPWSNGIVERHNAILYETMQKTKEDVRCSDEIALAWSVAANNALQNNSGFCPNQLVFGKNVNLPAIFDDKPPALGSAYKSDIVRENLNAFHEARKNFVKAESSERIRRALKHNIRTYSEEVFESVDQVYFKRKFDRD